MITFLEKRKERKKLFQLFEENSSFQLIYSRETHSLISFQARKK